jgi:hypothetical protein
MVVADRSALHATDRYEQRWTPILSRSATAAPGRSHAFSAVFGLLDGVSIDVDAKLTQMRHPQHFASEDVKARS